MSKELRKILEGLERKNDNVFTYGKKGNPIKDIHGSWISAVRRAGIKKRLRVHDIRHTFGTKLMKITDAETVRKTLGHASLEMTQKYVHSSSKDAQETIDKTFNGKGK